MNNMFLKNTDTKPGPIQTLQQNHNHKYLHVKGTKDTFVKLSKSVERLKTQSLELFFNTQTIKGTMIFTVRSGLGFKWIQFKYRIQFLTTITELLAGLMHFHEN